MPNFIEMGAREDCSHTFIVWCEEEKYEEYLTSFMNLYVSQELLGVKIWYVRYGI